MKRALLVSSVLMALAIPAFAALFGPKGDDVEKKRAEVRKQRQEILAKLYAEKPEAKAKIQHAAGYGTFNNRNLNLFLLSSGSGYGMVTDKSGKEVFMAMGSLGGGVGFGGKDLSVVFIFKNNDVIKQFVESGKTSSFNYRSHKRRENSRAAFVNIRGPEVERGSTNFKADADQNQ